MIFEKNWSQKPEGERTQKKDNIVFLQVVLGLDFADVIRLDPT